jgi:heat shock protein HtpX
MTRASARHYMRQNLLHSLLLLLGMFTLLALIGWLILGVTGVFWSLRIVVFVIISSRRLSPRLLLYLYGAQPLTPQQAPDLYELLAQLSNRASLPYPPRLYVIPGRIMNAFTIGQNQHTCIALSKGILTSMNARELAGVLAHEVAHIRHRDLWVMTLADVLSRLTHLLALTGLFMIMVYLPMFILAGETIPWLLFIILLMSPNLSALLQLALSRSREYSADIEAVNLTGDPYGLASALEKIEYYQGGWVERILLPGRRLPDPSLLRSHPRTEQRIKRILEISGQ